MEQTMTQSKDVVQDILKKVEVLVKERDDLLDQRNVFLSEMIEAKVRNGEKPVAFVYKNPDTQSLELIKPARMNEFRRELSKSMEQDNRPDIKTLWRDGERMVILVEGLSGF